jgi:hypothetical protein
VVPFQLTEIGGNLITIETLAEQTLVVDGVERIRRVCERTNDIVSGSFHVNHVAARRSLSLRHQSGFVIDCRALRDRSRV